MCAIFVACKEMAATQRSRVPRSTRGNATHGALVVLALGVVANACAQTGAAADAAQAAVVADSTQTVVVSGRSANLVGVADSATEGTLTARQLAARPLLRPAEVLESIPGLIVTQHSGDGKANQYFLRGFNLDHGTDFATYVNGMPINEVTHAHGQGYSDLNFLSPELIDKINFRKGAYSAEDGDFDTTGIARMAYANVVARPFIDVTAGPNDYRRAFAVGSRRLGDFDLLGAIDYTRTNGPWVQPEGLRKFSGVLRLSSGTAGNGFNITAMGYDAHWIATEEVPERAIEDGEISRYGTLAPTDGGKTGRYSLSGEWARADETSSTHANGYVIRYALDLFSTPSGLQESQHEQLDNRTTWGGGLEHDWHLGPKLFDSDLTVGAGLRQDRIPKVGLYETVDRQRTSAVRQDALIETATNAFADVRTQWTPWFRSVAGMRVDNIQAADTATGGLYNMDNSGRSGASQVSPKVAVAFGPFAGTEFYANWGLGFHSNDARGAISSVNPSDGSAAEPVGLISRAMDTEIGVRTSPLTGWNTGLSLWTTHLASELVFVGDDGVTEPEGGSRRYGVEWWNDATIGRWINVDADVAISHARFEQASNGGRYVPNAIPLSASLGITADAKGPWLAGVRLRYIGAYPLEETGTEKASPAFTANVKLGYRIDPRWQLSADILNLFNAKAYDIAYWGSSCTRSEGVACNNGNGVDGRLVHPMEPRTIRVSIKASL